MLGAVGLKLIGLSLPENFLHAEDCQDSCGEVDGDWSANYEHSAGADWNGQYYGNDDGTSSGQQYESGDPRWNRGAAADWNSRYCGTGVSAEYRSENSFTGPPLPARRQPYPDRGWANVSARHHPTPPQYLAPEPTTEIGWVSFVPPRDVLRRPNPIAELQHSITPPLTQGRSSYHSVASTANPKMHEVAALVGEALSCLNPSTADALCAEALTQGQDEQQASVQSVDSAARRIHPPPSPSRGSDGPDLSQPPPQSLQQALSSSLVAPTAPPRRQFMTASLDSSSHVRTAPSSGASTSSLLGSVADAAPQQEHPRTSRRPPLSPSPSVKSSLPISPSRVRASRRRSSSVTNPDSPLTRRGRSTSGSDSLHDLPSPTPHTREAIRVTSDRCHQTYGSIASFQLHKSQKHGAAKTLKCDHCERHFASDHARNYHVTRMHATEQFTCDTCNKKCGSKNSLRSHKNRQHGVSLAKTLKCDHCERLFEHDSARRRHTTTVHVTDAKRFTCELCNRNYSSKNSLRTHRSLKHRLPTLSL